nr:MAG TPA: hypothetical protein [Caudoviricetes sp.]
MSKVLTHTCTGACMRDVPGSINFESWGKCPREKGASRNFSFSFNLLFSSISAWMQRNRPGTDCFYRFVPSWYPI